MPASRFAQVSATHATRISKLDTTRQCPCLLFQHPQLLIECMKLQDFLRDSLLEIMNGVAEARKINRNIGGCVEALGKQDASCKFKDGEVGFLVNFDVAVTVSQKNSKEAGAGIQVVAINAGGRGSAASEHSSITRIQFSVPIIFRTVAENFAEAQKFLAGDTGAK
jgi:hypothetical protein